MPPQRCNSDNSLTRALLMCPFFRCENWGKVSSFPSFWIWKEEVLGNVGRGTEEEAPYV